MLGRTHYIFGFAALLFFSSCTNENDEKKVEAAVFSQWKMVNPSANVVLLVRTDSTFHVDVALQVGIEIEGLVELNHGEISFINTHGTDSISSDPRPGSYSYEIKSDTIYFDQINDPIDRRAGFLAFPWVKTSK